MIKSILVALTLAALPISANAASQTFTVAECGGWKSLSAKLFVKIEMPHDREALASDVIEATFETAPATDLGAPAKTLYLSGETAKRMIANLFLKGITIESGTFLFTSNPHSLAGEIEDAPVPLESESVLVTPHPTGEVSANFGINANSVDLKSLTQTKLYAFCQQFDRAGKALPHKK